MGPNKAFVVVSTVASKNLDVGEGMKARDVLLAMGVKDENLTKAAIVVNGQAATLETMVCAGATFVATLNISGG